MSAISEVKICNIALSILGDKAITSRSDDNKRARALDAVYDEVRDDVLADHPWSFAQKRAALSLLDEDPEYTDDGVLYVYQLPTDCIKVNATNVENALVKIESNTLLSDTSGRYIKYTCREEDPQKYFAKFIMAFATRLAAEVCYSLTSSRTFAADLLAAYHNKRLPEAMSADSQQGTPLPPMQDDVLLARISGVGGVVGRTGWETWYPIG